MTQKKYYALVAGKNDYPLSSDELVGAKATAKRYYQHLVTAFGLGPFTLDEGIGALRATCGVGREEAEHVIFNMMTILKLIYTN